MSLSDEFQTILMNIEWTWQANLQFSDIKILCEIESLLTSNNSNLEAGVGSSQPFNPWTTNARFISIPLKLDAISDAISELNAPSK